MSPILDFSRALLLLIFLPLAGAVFIAGSTRGEARGESAQSAKWLALWFSVLAFGLSLYLLGGFDTADPNPQFVSSYKPALLLRGVEYAVGVDGISLLFIVLITFLMPLCILTGWHSINKHVREYLIFLLVLESLMILVFAAQDVFLFYLSFEGSLVPMFLIIGIWGGPGRIYASFKFFLYTLLGSLLMLLAVIVLYRSCGGTTFDQLMAGAPRLSHSAQIWLFLAFLASFAVKLPMFPVHTWLPDAHVEAPTAGSMILAAVLLKMGGYGFLRFCLPLFPHASQVFGPLVLGLSVVAIVYASLVALAQEDMKKLVAYSSISHMGFVTMGVFSGTLQSVQGAVFVMVSHGLVSAAMFLCVGVLYDRTHTRLIADYGGLAKPMPLYAACFLFLTMANIGLPGTSGFIGEFLSILGTFPVSKVMASLAALGVVLSAVYALHLYRRVAFSSLESGALAALKDLDWREVLIFAPLTLSILLLGVYPAPVLNLSGGAVEKIVHHYAHSS